MHRSGKLVPSCCCLDLASSLVDEAGMLEEEAELCVLLCSTDLDVRKGKVKQQS